MYTRGIQNVLAECHISYCRLVKTKFVHVTAKIIIIIIIIITIIIMISFM
jgi:hypothetical protein